MLKFRLIGGIFMIGALLLSACGGIPQELAMTLTAAPDQIRTQAVSTFSADITLTALAAPTNTPAPTATPMPTITLAPTLTGGVALGTAPAATTACYGLAFVSETIPDGTSMNPGQKFTKSWKVQNTGSCAWEAGFKFTSIDGDAMGGAAYTLPNAVASGAVTDIAIAMTAPTKAGKAHGDWQMATASGQTFGTAVWVEINVGGGPTATNTSSGAGAATATSTATPTATSSQ